MLYQPDTISAIATPPGDGGVGIVRISGPDAFTISARIFTSASATREAGTFAFGKIKQLDGQGIDEGIALFFRDPHSFTGEDVVELQAHGGAVNMRRILRATLDAGARLAEPGEFSRRAFLNGKMDLLQAEAIADLIHARSDRAAAAAQEQLDGSLSRQFDTLYTALLNTAADIETTLDFIEDELPDQLVPNLIASLQTQSDSLAALLGTWDEGRLLREGLQCVILGRPNAGKSTMLNALLGTNRAIVSATAGTTRDIIEEQFILDGIPIRLLDTAGLRQTDCDIEMEGIRRARQTQAQADLSLYVIDSSVALSAADEENIKALDPASTLLILNKSDLRAPSAEFTIAGFSTVDASLQSGEGLADIKRAIAQIIEGETDFMKPAHAVISERHRGLLVVAQTELTQALSIISLADDQIVFAAQHLREALEKLGEVTGKVFHESLLDSVFSRFCIGK